MNTSPRNLTDSRLAGITGATIANLALQRDCRVALAASDLYFHLIMSFHSFSLCRPANNGINRSGMGSQVSSVKAGSVLWKRVVSRLLISYSSVSIWSHEFVGR